jgi:DeoR family transcriptional regulator, galactitol utilization operon repressor
MTFDRVNDRKKEILEILAQEGSVSVAEISRNLNVSAVTVRNDLSSLEDEGFVIRTRGGASPAFHPSIIERKRQRSEEKTGIARRAAELVDDGDTIMIEAGTTTALLARFLFGRRDVHVVTNSTLLLPYARTNPSIHLTVTGGEFRPITESFVGPIALANLEQFHVRTAFIGTDGFSVAGGLTTHLVEGAEIVRKMAAQADRVVLLADSSKYGRAGFAHVLALDEVDVCIVDSGLDENDRAAIESRSVEVVIV